MQVFNTLAAATDPTTGGTPTDPTTSSSSTTNPIAPDQLANESTFLEQLLGINQGVQTLVTKAPDPTPAPTPISPNNIVAQ
jgi:hypothetical protein